MGSSLAGMVNEQHGHLEAALEMAQVAEHGGHLGRDVLVDAVQADERIEHEQPRPEPLDGLRSRLWSSPRSRRRLGLVMMWISRLSKGTSAARAIPSIL